ncbi:MAG: hypothetical protein FWE91_04520 [Defluviitaleaceae bacterium]|nr:hypothetical protein [Defluviitaleaceae bacterium]
MKPKKYKVNLSTAERNEAEAIIKRGKHSASTTKRANILLNLDENGGKAGSQEEIAKHLTIKSITFSDWICLFYLRLV